MEKYGVQKYGVQNYCVTQPYLLKTIDTRGYDNILSIVK